MRITSIQADHIELLAKKGHLAEHLPAVLDSAHPEFLLTADDLKKSQKISEASIQIKAYDGEIQKSEWNRKIVPGMQLRYDGPALQSERKVCIRTVCRTSDGETVSEEASFLMGKMKHSWNGQWISDPTYRFHSPSSPVPMVFRKRFCLDQPVRTMRMHLCALGILTCFVDGKRVSDDYFAPGFTDYRYDLQYATYETGPLEKGNHELLITVAGGWALGRTTHIANTGKSITKLFGERQALLGEFLLPNEEGRMTASFGTDETFEVSEEGPVRFADFYDGEEIDGRIDLEKIRWKQAGMEKLKIHPVISTSAGLPVLPCRKLHAKYIGTSSEGELIYDFGQNFAGVPDLEIHGADGQRIVIRHAEILEKGDLFTKNLRSAKQHLIYTCREGNQHVSPTLTFMGFRYIGVRGATKENLTDVSAIALSTSLPVTGSFLCSDPLLSKLQSNIVWSARSNFLDIPTDCPQRDERQGWTGDIALFGSTAAFNFDCFRFFSKWLRDMRHEQGRFGTLPFVVPERIGVTPKMTTSCWSDACIDVPWASWLSNGDASILREMYPVMKKYMADVSRLSALSLPKYHSRYIFALPFQFGDWCAPYGNVQDWLKKGPWVGTAYYFHSACRMEETARILGNSKDAEHYRALSEKIRNAYFKVFTDGTGRLKEEFQTGYVLPLYFHMYRNEQEEKVMADRLVHLIEKNGGHLSTGFTATPYILFALSDHGKQKEAWNLLMQDSAPSWLAQIKEGATTIWEQWNVINEDGTVKEASLNHYACGAVGDFLYRRICGLEAEDAGYRTFRVHPYPDLRLHDASCTKQTPYGTILVSWTLQEGTFVMNLKVPYGCECHVILPDGRKEKVKHGQYRFACVYGREEDAGRKGAASASGSDAG